MAKTPGKYAPRWAFIVNPVSGGGKGGACFSYLEGLKRTVHPEIDIFLTKRRGDATRICGRLLTKGYRRFVAVGGDGTVNEVIQSLGGQRDCVLGVFPAGSGNDYAPGAGFPAGCRIDDMEEIFRCREVPVDV